MCWSLLESNGIMVEKFVNISLYFLQNIFRTGKTIFVRGESSERVYKENVCD
jgi:hypothetical protein